MTKNTIKVWKNFTHFSNRLVSLYSYTLDGKNVLNHKSINCNVEDILLNLFVTTHQIYLKVLNKYQFEKTLI